MDARRKSLHRNRVNREQDAITAARTERSARSLQLFAGAMIAAIAGLAVFIAPHAGAIAASLTH